MRTRFARAALSAAVIFLAFRGFAAEPIPLRVASEAGKVLLIPDVPVGAVAELKVIGAPPSFTVVVAIYDKGKLSIVTVPVALGTGAPGPGPGPGPEDPLSGVAALMNQWANESVPPEVRAASAQRLAASFESLVAKIGAGALKAVPEILAESKKANQEALGADYDKWSAVREKLRVYSNAENAAGRLSTVDQVKAMFADLAKGLRRVK